MKNILNQLYNQESLTRAQATDVLTHISEGKMNASEIVSFITVYLMRCITVDELMGFRDAMLNMAITIDTEMDTIDLCGTGGDGKNTFNVSTLSSFIVAASGIPVAKHGNYGVSSVSGSSNVMEYFGYKFSADQDKLKRELDQCKISFLHAPLFHPSLKAVSSIRRDLGIKTFFNMLGPLVNPAMPKYKYTGVFSLSLARLYHYVFQQSNEKYCVIYGHDGYDEISLTSSFRMYSNDFAGDKYPVDLGFEIISPQLLLGGDTVATSAATFKEILEGKACQDKLNVVAANAGLAIHTADPHKSLSDCIQSAMEILISGRASQTFNKLIAIQ
ncbi:MAG: anthranilate phosphoribosyltransferase [Bacteroidota bacterium]